jgi:hypothetical protein
MISKLTASSAVSRPAGSRNDVVEYEFKNPPGSGITIEVELRFNRTVQRGEA